MAVVATLGGPGRLRPRTRGGKSRSEGQREPTRLGVRGRRARSTGDGEDTEGGASDERESETGAIEGEQEGEEKAELKERKPTKAEESGALEKVDMIKGMLQNNSSDESEEEQQKKRTDRFLWLLVQRAGIPGCQAAAFSILCRLVTGSDLLPFAPGMSSDIGSQAIVVAIATAAPLIVYDAATLLPPVGGEGRIMVADPRGEPEKGDKGGNGLLKSAKHVLASYQSVSAGSDPGKDLQLWQTAIVIPARAIAEESLQRGVCVKFLSGWFSDRLLEADAVDDPQFAGMLLAGTCLVLFAMARRYRALLWRKGAKAKLAKVSLGERNKAEEGKEADMRAEAPHSVINRAISRIRLTALLDASRDILQQACLTAGYMVTGSLVTPIYGSVLSEAFLTSVQGVIRAREKERQLSALERMRSLFEERMAEREKNELGSASPAGESGESEASELQGGEEKGHSSAEGDKENEAAVSAGEDSELAQTLEELAQLRRRSG